MEKLQTKDQFQELKNGRTIFMFSADWCPDCRVIEPILPEVEANFPHYQFMYVDRDDFIEICQELDIFGIPSFVAFENGQETGRFVSKNRKTQQEIENFIKNLGK